MARELHRVVGFSLAGGWALLLVAGLTVAVRKRDAGRLYRGLLVLVEVTLGVQVLAGLAVLATGGQPPLLHYIYGAVAPALLLVEAHLLTPRLKELPDHLLFTVAAAVNLMLTARALQTGFGG
jgi:zinc transporter ZupT